MQNEIGQWRDKAREVETEAKEARGKLQELMKDLQTSI